MRKDTPRDPVAKNIMNQMNRDAAPSPAEAEEMAREALDECENCGEDDFELLSQYDEVTLYCPMGGAKEKFVVLCDECAEERPNKRELATQKAREQEDVEGFVIYDCGNVVFLKPEVPTMTTEVQEGWDDDGNPVMVEKEMEKPHANPEVTIQWNCKCGGDIEEVVTDLED